MLCFRQHIMVLVMEMLEESDYEILEKYKDGRTVDPGEELRVERLYRMGLMEMGTKFSTDTYLANATASTSYLGKKFLSFNTNRNK